MQLAVSSIAWTNEEEEAVAKILQQLNVHKVELAPTKLWDDPTTATAEQAQEVVEWWKGYGIEIAAFQSMLFSRPDLKLFQDEGNRRECLDYLKDFIALAGMMGVKKMVFGSPKNRQRGELSVEEADAIAIEFFREIGETAEKHNVVFCLEPNAPQYNCDYITTAAQGAKLVRAVGSHGFGLHLDAACMALAGDDLGRSIRENKDILEHFHISSPMLEQVEARSDVAHADAAEALRSIDYNKVVSIEMRPGDSGTNVSRVEKAVLFAKDTYGI